MTILVYHSNCSLSSRSSMAHQRPSHNPSKNLTQKEIQCLYDLLGENCVTLATAVVQIVYGTDNIWKKQGCGVLCYIKDYNRKNYCFRLYNLKSKEIIFEEKTLVSLSLEKVLDQFYTFDGTKCKIGINFVDENEAETFCKCFHDKQTDRKKKMETSKSNNTSISALINGIQIPSNNIIKTSIPSPTPNKKIKSKNSKRETKKYRYLTISGPITPSFQHVIHVGPNNSFITDETKKELFDKVLSDMHITPEQEIYIRHAVNTTNNGLEKLFTKPMHVDNTQEYQDRPPMIPPRIPTIRKRIPHQDVSLPSTTYQHTSLVHPQLQNTCNPSIDFKQSKPPAVLPKPTHRAPNNTQQSTKNIRAPTPPLSNNLQNSSTSPPVAPLVSPKPLNFSAPRLTAPPVSIKPKNFSVPPPSTSSLSTKSENFNVPPPAAPPVPIKPQNFRVPPPSTPSLPTKLENFNVPPPAAPPLPTKPENFNVPPPAPPPLPTDFFDVKENLSIPSSPSVSVSEQVTNVSSEPNSLLKAICDFNPDRLKSAAQRSIPVIKPTENQVNQDVHNTLAENIRLLLDKRRKEIMGSDNDEDDENDDDDEWDA